MQTHAIACGAIRRRVGNVHPAVDKPAAAVAGTGAPGYPSAMRDPATGRSPPAGHDGLAGLSRPRWAGPAGKAGLLPRQEIRNLVRRRIVRAQQDWDETQFQPAIL